ncbi:hypothetical protein SPRG_05493 [Saprolegnia parasitica CBS 223.65]|uniref:BZIP domain-containing protein n=1 Tax=Saprolegnia parasitica (strain CBS 223.65) TaxID=695850 RepID=A0A067CRU9_SAPPC|nr:hypothetical protein SPRG_05493 [Saprolegnia parasitica CBS 223.65]KDO29537.1 hypothetical protein SPRG_05493 [Saprolegnia parasitica CBS 223.65]|eukprot:XP_012199602.1 hypothetical protein SPRG_05493 [Saprolegnia parasitica CBS 223.65]
MPTSRLPRTQKATERRQIQCRNNQRRYREEARVHMAALEKQVYALTRETARLEGRMDTMAIMLPPPPPTLGATSGVARCREYCDALMHGYALSDPPRERYQLAIMRQLFTSDATVIGASTTGVDAIIANWRAYASCFPNMRKECHAYDYIEVEDDVSLVKGVGMLYLRITRATIEQLFPSILCNERLVQRLVGRELPCPCTQSFYLADLGERLMVTRLATEIDLVTAFWALLSDVDDILHLLHDCHLTSYAQIQSQSKPIK